MTNLATCSTPATSNQVVIPCTVILALVLLAICPLAGAATRRVHPGQGSPMIQRIIREASPGDTVAFEAGTYTITSGLILKCGITYTAAIPATPSNVVLNASFPEESTDIFTLNSGCTRATTVSYLSALHAGLLYVLTPNANLTITHNQVGDLKCCSGQVYSPALYFNDPGSGTANYLTNATVTWNQLGDSTSCTAPQNGMTFTGSPETYQGICSGIMVQTSVNGMTIKNNNFFHVAEGIHFLCYGSTCDPPNGPVTSNVTAEFNDFNSIHRIAWEQQPEKTTGIVFEYNSMHDWYYAYFGTFGVSFACCANHTTTSPYLNVSNNVISFNAQPSPTYGVYGYGVEGWGLNATYSNNWVGTTKYDWCVGIKGCAGPGPGMAWGYGTPSNMSYNTVCGPMFATHGYIVAEFPQYTLKPPTHAGNVTNATCSPATSATPTISPASGNVTFPLTVTLTDAGNSPTTPSPTGNTGIWYTTDGSAPVPGSGTAQYLASGGTFVLTAPATVKAVGMWGAPNQPTKYPAGYGFVPSAMQSADYSNGPASQRPPR